MTMGNKFRSSVATLIVAGMVLTSLNLGSAQAAPKQAQVQAAGTLDMSARSRQHQRQYNRHRGNDRAAIAAFGMVAGAIAGIAAAQESRRYYRQNYYDGYDDYPPPAYGYGGFGGYYGGYRPHW
jgi:hypothetical protein